MKRIAVVFQTHLWSAIHALRYERLRSDLAEHADCHILYDATTSDSGREAVSTYAEAEFFSADGLQQNLGYSFFSGRGLVPGSQHYPLLEFSRRHDYTQYWLIEGDVEFSGNWARLLERTADSTADLIGSHLHPCSAAPQEIWWRRLTPPTGSPLEGSHEWKLSAFLPVARFSASALREIDRAHQAGWHGHSEVLIPSVLNQAGLKSADLNTFGPLYLPGGRDPVTRVRYSGSLRWRPPISSNEFVLHWMPDTIYHPIKQAWTWSPNGITREHRGQLKLFPFAQNAATRR